jgi:hypothetical protein
VRQRRGLEISVVAAARPWRYAAVDDAWRQNEPLYGRPGPAPHLVHSAPIIMALVGECRGWYSATDLVTAWRPYRDRSRASRSGAASIDGGADCGRQYSVEGEATVQRSSFVSLALGVSRVSSLWILANAAGMAAGGAGICALWVPGFLIFALGVASAQWLVIRSTVRAPRAWILVTASTVLAAWPVAIVAGIASLPLVVPLGRVVAPMRPYAEDGPQFLLLYLTASLPYVVAGIAAGTLVGIGQWAVLHDRIGAAAVWPLASGLGGAVLGPLLVNQVIGFCYGGDVEHIIGGGASMAAAGAIYGAITTPALLLMARRGDRRGNPPTGVAAGT